MGKPSAPKPPDPKETAAAQTGTNVSTAIANATLGNVNQQTPYGSLDFSQSGSTSFTDPTTGATYEIPQFTATQTLSDPQQKLLETGQGTQQNLADLAQQQSRFLQGHLSQPFDGSNEATEGRLIELGRRRLDPAFDQRRDALEQDLANRGIGIGSRAYTSAVENLDQARNDATNQLLLSGNQQAFSQRLAERSAPINEISALASGSQVSQPNFVGTNQPQIPTVDYAGLVNQNYSNQLGAYNQQMQQSQGLMGGLFGLGSAAIMASDERVKDDMRKVGEIKGHNVYEYTYKGDKTPQIGLSAQEVERKTPGAVVTGRTGMKLVDYGKALMEGGSHG